MGSARFWTAITLLVAGNLALVGTQSRLPFPGTLDQHPAINYGLSTGEDPVSRLDRQLELGDAKLTFEPGLGYLRSLLAALDVPVESQLLLFSKTAVQQAYTSPETPRALYFNDSVVVGYIPGAPLLEVASHDPRQGVRFFSLSQDEKSPPSFATHERCLTCHLSSNSLDVPGLLVRSMFTGPDGGTRPQMGSFLVDHRVPFERRWGGWYVTGTHGAMRHLGNAMVDDATGPEAAVSAATLNQRAISPRVETRAYPLPSSDIVALMVFDHQARAVQPAHAPGMGGAHGGPGTAPRFHARRPARPGAGGRGLLVVRGRGAARGSGGGRVGLREDSSRRGGRAMRRDDCCGISICRRGC